MNNEDRDLQCIRPDQAARDYYGFGPTEHYVATEGEVRARIGYLVRQSGLTAKDYAARIELAPDQLSKILHGKRRPSSLEIALIATFSKVTAGWILAMDETTYPRRPHIPGPVS